MLYLKYLVFSLQSFYLKDLAFFIRLLQVSVMKNWSVLHELTQEQAHVSV